MLNVIVIDTETTGVDPEKDRVVEIGAVKVSMTKKGPKLAGTFQTLVNPGMPIPPVARGIHHISDEEVSEAPSFDEALSDLRKWAGKEMIPAAHNAKFDSAFFPKKKGWICTWRSARHLWPDFESHSNQSLRYLLPEVNEAIEKAGKEKALPAHRALPDAWVTAHVILEMLKDETPSSLLDLTNSPITLKKVTFGMHRGKLWTEVPRDYLSWVLRQKDMDEDVKHTADTVLRNI